MVGMVVGAHGFAGYGPEQQGTGNRANWAVYTDFDTDIVEGVTLSAALRYEDFQDFGDDLLGEYVERRGADVDLIEFAAAGHVEQCGALDELIAGLRENPPFCQRADVV